MNRNLDLLLLLQKRRLSIRLLIYVGLCSLGFVVLASLFQLYAEYNRDIEAVEANLQFIETSYVPAITASLYQLDEKQMRLGLQGALQLQDIAYLQVTEQTGNKKYRVAEGNPEVENALTREFPLIYRVSTDRSIPVGTLLVKASLTGVYQRLQERALMVVITNGLVVLLVAASILLIFQFALTRHLVKMADYARSLNLDKLDRELVLKRKTSKLTAPDELDQLVTAINEMRVRLMKDMAARLQAEKQLQFQKTLLECELEASPDGILITNTEGKTLYFNRRFVEMWHLSVDSAAALPNQFAFMFIKDMVAQPETSFAKAIYLYEHLDEENHEEITLKNGEVFERYTVPVRSAEGEYYGRLWSYRDITRRKTLEEQLRQAQKLEAVGRLAGGIAHDFNNLLVPIVGYTELGMMRLSPDDKLYTDLSRIRQAAERATGLTRQILAFSRKQLLEVGIFDLNRIIAEFEKMLQRLIGEDIQVQTYLTPTLYPVRVDRTQIEQILLNLVLNARDAMPQGGKLTLETANTFLDETYVEKHAGVQPGQYVMLAVSDTGHGMDAETQRYIFDPFFTTKEPGKGTGLGLATVFGIVKQHQGHIWVYSEPGYGTIFKIYLPQAEGTPQVDTDEAEATTPLHGTETILVVEDAEMVRNLVCETLTAHGYRVIEASHPADAQQLASDYNEPIHLLLTDVIMPQMNGRELYQKLSTLSPEIKVLYMSGYTDNVIVHHGILYEGVNFLQKPFTVHDLIQKIRKVLSFSSALSS